MIGMLLAAAIRLSFDEKKLSQSLALAVYGLELIIAGRRKIRNGRIWDPEEGRGALVYHR